MTFDNFDWKKYVDFYDDLKKANINTKEKAINHWINYGQYEKRYFFVLNDNFDWEQYVANYEDLRKSEINTKNAAYEHWINHGILEGRTYKKIKPIDNFDWNQYLENNIDLQISGINNYNSAIKHWINHGQNEKRSFNLTDNQTFKKFLQDYNETYENYINNSKVQFRYECYKNISYMRNIELPLIKLNKNNEAVLIEYRILPHLEFIIRNNINKLGDEWSHTVICGNLNYEYMNTMCKNISSEIKVIKTNYDNLDQSTYSLFLSSLNFWNLITGSKILIYQEDSLIFKSNINDFLKWDYIGAPWPENQNDNINGVGNGGLSLRTKKCMIDVINNISLQDTQFNTHTIEWMNNVKMTVGPEDVYFSLNMLKYNIGIVADRNAAFDFSSESICNKNSFGGHNFWISDPSWKDRIYENIVFKFKNFNNFSILEHRGGWKSIVCSFFNSDLYNYNSKYEFYDMIENYFLWNLKYQTNKNWFGIIHCTQKAPEYLSCVNIEKLFDNANFIKSLDTCKFIIVLSNYVKEYLDDQFLKINKNVQVFTLKHPVDQTNIIYFNFNKFLNNPNKKIIQIGQQLRKMSSIYLIKSDFEKIWLTGTKKLNNVKNCLNKELETYNLSIDLSKVKMFYTDTIEEFDILLSENIVFIDLFDASANNTVLECIIRNTPIIVNKLPAIIEYLGENYPLFYNNLDEVENLITEENILLAHKYLLELQKNELNISYFSSKIINLVSKNFTS